MSNKYSSCLICPITFVLFYDPVVAEDGHTYEREAITNWIQHNCTSPLTREPITIEGLRPNHVVRSLVDEFKKTLSKRNYKFKLGVDIKRCQTPFFQSTGKALFEAEWIGNPNGPRIVLLKLFGAHAEKEASFYEELTRHPHIVYTYGLVEQVDTVSNDYLMLLQEMAPLGSLINVLENHVEEHPNSPLSDILLNHIFLQICEAMIHLSSKRIIHGDLACRNVLVFYFNVTEPDRVLVKLTDFGISRGNSLYSKIEAIQTVIDTIPIRTSAPEVLKNHSNDVDDDDDPLSAFSEKSDMFAMGVLMWEIYSNGKIPWSEIKREQEIRQRVVRGERLSRPANCKSDRQWNLILKCMSQDPNARPTFNELAEELKNCIDLSNNTIINHPDELVNCSTSLPVIQEQTILERKDDALTSSFIVQESETIHLENSDKLRLATSLSIGSNIAKAKSFFEQEISKQKSSSIVRRLKSNPTSKSLNEPSTIKKQPPCEELIKLTKWH